MGKLLPAYKKAIIDEILDNVSSNTSHYYAFASNPTPYPGDSVPAITNDDYNTTFEPLWDMIFGKKLKSGDIVPVIKNNKWVANTVYDRYDNSSNTVLINNNFYVITEPSYAPGAYLIYKCIDNNNGGLSTIDPKLFSNPKQLSTFQTSDGYKWRYIASIDYQSYNKFFTNDYSPIYPDRNVISYASSYAGVETVTIDSGGSGYIVVANGTIKANPSNTLVQIADNSSEDNGYYTNSAILFTNQGAAAASELKTIINYYVDNGNKWVVLDSPVNTDNLIENVTSYLITPRVVFHSDGDRDPSGYCVINQVNNTIQSVQIFDSGSNISWANAYVQSNPAYGSGAALSAIVPPAGGHGSDPVTELNVKGFAVSFSFEGTEVNNILSSNTNFNKVGLFKNPLALTANNTIGNRFYSDVFNQCLVGTLSPEYTFSKEQKVVGVTSGAIGTVVFANSSTVYLTGDKNFANNEYLRLENSTTDLTTLQIQSRGSVYVKNLKPFYVQNINNVNRQDEQTQSFKLIIQL